MATAAPPAAASGASSSSATTARAATVQPGRYSVDPNPGDLPAARELKAVIPPHCFVKSLPRSLAYLVRDMGLVIGMLCLMAALMHSDAWRGLPAGGADDADDNSTATARLAAAWLGWLPVQLAVIAAHWTLTGFFMWCVFVVGHDCGHTTFSEHQWLNDILGHVTHGSILVPYWPWARSHRMHHQFHNNGAKDLSHWWFHPDERELSEIPMAAAVGGRARMTMPVLGWPLYILFGEGGHFTPFGGALWEGASLVERVKCLVSGAVVVANLFLVCYLLDFEPLTIAVVYFGPYFVFSWWLFTVTFLQHHHDESVVYSDGAWSFLKGAFETVDRRYGMGVDDFHHNISDGHIVHHLFFTAMPHYHLTEATKAVHGYMKKQGFGNWWLQKDNSLGGKDGWFVLEVWRHMWEHSFKAKDWIAPADDAAAAAAAVTTAEQKKGQ